MEASTEIIASEMARFLLSIRCAVLASLKRMISLILYAIIFCLECSIGLCIGGVLGAITGWCTALVYKDFYKPEHLETVEEILHWYLLPGQYARIGLVIGAVIGVFAILWISFIKPAVIVPKSAVSIKCHSVS